MKHWVQGICIFLLIMNSLAYAKPGFCPIVRLEPQIKSEPYVPSPYPMDTIKPFLKNSLIVWHRALLACSLRVIGLDHQIGNGGKGDYIYVRGINNVEERMYNIYNAGRNHYHPVTREHLGYEAELIGKAELTILDNISELKILEASEAVQIGAFILPSSEQPPIRDFIAKPGTTRCDGFIMKQENGAPDIGRNDAIVISLGTRDGVSAGDIFDIYQVNLKRTICEPCPCRPRLPDHKAGRVLVYQTFEKMSLALVVEAEEVINLMDRVRGPVD